MNQHTEPTSSKSVCRICLKPIELGAKKCTECGSYQDWRRHFSFGTVALSLLIALISVSTTAIQVAKSLMAKEQSDLRFSLVKYGPNGIMIMGSNLGDRAGALKSASLQINLASETKDYKLTWDDVDLVIKPGGWRLFKMKPTTDGDVLDLQMLPFENEKCTHTITFDVLAFDHQPSSSSINYKCRKI